MKTSYDEPIATGGNREDLSDVIWDITPTETPFISMCGSSKSKGTSHDWLTDELNDPAENAAVEGAEAGADTSSDRARLSNFTQIFTKTAKVSGTQEKVDKAGIKSEMAYQVARRMKEIKRDVEAACVGTFGTLQRAKAAGGESTARKMGGFVSYMTADSFTDIATGGTPSDPSGNGTDMPTLGTTPVAFSEDVLKAALEEMWTNSGGNENISAIMGSFNRGKFSGFQSTATRYVTTDQARLQASIDVYDGDFHTVTATPDRFSAKNAVYLVDKEYVKLADLRPVFTKDLAISGDYIRKQIIWETTLEMCNPLAHHVIAGTTTSA